MLEAPKLFRKDAGTRWDWDWDDDCAIEVHMGLDGYIFLRYPLGIWNSYWKWPFIASYLMKERWFSIAMLVYQRVFKDSIMAYYLVGGLEHYGVSIYWECHHPKWLSYLSEGSAQPPTSYSLIWSPILWCFIHTSLCRSCWRSFFRVAGRCCEHLDWNYLWKQWGLMIYAFIRICNMYLHTQPTWYFPLILFGSVLWFHLWCTWTFLELSCSLFQRQVSRMCLVWWSVLSINRKDQGKFIKKSI